MNGRVSINGEWRLRGFDGQHGYPEHYLAADADETLFINAAVPGEVHLDLMCAGLIDDLNVARNAQAARWVEECVWLYRRTFCAPPEAVRAKAAWLAFEGLDNAAVVYLNGQEVGRHANTFIPARFNVAGRLVEGENTIAVRIESGLFSVGDKPASPYIPAGIDHLLHKRMWLRKPQYTFSWDWNPRLVNVGIWRPAWLEWADEARLDAAVVFPELSDDHRHAKIHCRAFVENVAGGDLPAKLRLTCTETGAAIEQDMTLPAGTSRHDLAVAIENPKLWWPRPHGDQPLYSVTAALLVDGREIGSITKRTAIRSVRIAQPPHPVAGKHFIIEINGRPIFLKGGNWAPPDMIYGRVDAGRFRRLVELAADANFNALRVWGGGWFIDHAVLDACDELGIVVWHDFLYACAKYPADDYDFMQNVKTEATFGVRDLAHHPSLIVWCGNNEIEWGVWGWGYERGKPFPDYSLYHHVLPVIVKTEDPSRPYWPSSPYSPDHEFPNSPLSGDQHPWDVSLGHYAENFWGYRVDVSRFPNEGGMLGASTPATVRQFLPEGERRIHSPSWVFHDNAMNFNSRPCLIHKMFSTWLGMVPENMPFDDYLFYSSLLQAEGLKEYADNFRRRMFSSSCAIFWSYNDSWPVSHGWTILDYYLRRKLSYHPVRRAFQPVTVIPAIEGDPGAADEIVSFFCVNETAQDWHGQLRFGIANLSGGMPIVTPDTPNSDCCGPDCGCCIPANSSVAYGFIPMARWREIGTRKSIAFALLMQGGAVIAQNRIFSERFKDMEWPRPEITVRRDGPHAVFSSPAFAWCVTLDLDGERPLPDNAFDLLPGIDYRVPWPEGEELPKVVRVGNV